MVWAGHTRSPPFYPFVITSVPNATQWIIQNLFHCLKVTFFSLPLIVHILWSGCIKKNMLICNSIFIRDSYTLSYIYNWRMINWGVVNCDPGQHAVLALMSHYYRVGSWAVMVLHSWSKIMTFCNVTQFLWLLSIFKSWNDNWKHAFFFSHTVQYTFSQFVTNVLIIWHWDCLAMGVGIQWIWIMLNYHYLIMMMMMMMSVWSCSLWAILVSLLTNS